MADEETSLSLTAKQARNLSNTTKTIPQMGSVTPRWFLQMVPWVNLEAGTYRVNRRRSVVRGRKVPIDVQNGIARVGGEQLKALDLFTECGDDVLEGLASKFASDSFNMGETIISKGEEGDKFFIVAEGKLAIWDTGDHGNKIRLGMLTDGDHVGEMALISGGPRVANVEAITPCVLLSLDRGVFNSLVDDTPGLREKIETTMANRSATNARVNEYGEDITDVLTSAEGEEEVSGVHIDYEEDPREYSLHSMQSIVQVHTRISDLYNSPHNQVQQQLRLTVNSMKEKQEWEMINNPEFGLINSVSPSMRIPPRKGPPTPDDMDELISLVWKEPAYFLAHPRAIAAFGRECTRRGVPPAIIQMSGSSFLTWRGLPIIPCDKLLVDGMTRPTRSSGKTNILLVRVGEEKQGVVGLHQAGISGEHMPSLSVRLMGINHKSVADYLVTLYFSLAVLTEDAVGCLENVEVGNYYDYE